MHSDENDKLTKLKSIENASSNEVCMGSPVIANNVTKSKQTSKYKVQ